MRVELRDIRKSYGPVRANDGISLTLEPGGIHGLLGENGAGKTTLMKVLSGFVSADGGEIVLDGATASFHSPSDAIAAGIGMLHQDPLDFPALSVLDDFLLGRGGGLVSDRRGARKGLTEVAGRLGFTLDPDAQVSSLTIGERQQLEIVRLLSLGVSVLILDEPTTGISADQKSALFGALRRLAVEGKTIVFVSHKLEDVQGLCQDVTVLRQGKVAGQCGLPCPTDYLVETMFGRSLAQSDRPAIPMGDPALTLRDLSLRAGRVRITGLDLTVRRGEVIGLAGLEGSGQDLLLRACAGLLRPAAGRLVIGSRDLTGQPYRRFRDAGVSFVPAGRLEEGLVPGLDLCEHVVLAERGGPALVNWQAAKTATNELIGQFRIRGRPDSRVEELSGGNQQRALLSLLPPDLALLLMEHPTRGLDIESAQWVWSKLLERRAGGTAILFASSDLDEIMQHSDRVLVFFAGRVTRALECAQTSAAQLGEYIGGIDVPGSPTNA